MNFKKCILTVMVFVLVFSCFASCKKQNENDTLTSAPNDKNTVTNEKQDENSFVSLSETDTGLGLLTIPVFSTTLLNAESAEKANDFFAEIKKNILDNIEEYKSSDDYSKQTEKKFSPLCTVKTADSGNILSVLVEYYFYNSSETHFEAISFNTETGNPISPDDVLEKLGYTQTDIISSLRCYAVQAMFSQWEYQMFCDFAEKKEKLDGIGDPTFGWQVIIDTVETDYTSDKEPDDEKWADLPLYPTVFADENNQLFVCSNVPSSLNDEKYKTMVCIGHDNTETLYKNPDNPQGEPLSDSLVEQAALEAVSITMGLDKNMTDSNGAKYSITWEYLEMIDNGGKSQPAYICKAEKNGGDDRWFAVGAFTASVWEKDEKSDSWKSCADKDSFLPENVFTDNQTDGVLASVYNNPDELEAWCAPIDYNVDLTALSLNMNTDMGTNETSIIIANKDNTVITFTDIALNGDKFEPTSKLCSYTLDKGQCILVSLVRPEVIPSQAIVVENGKDKGMYVIQFDGRDETVKREYIKVDSAKN